MYVPWESVCMEHWNPYPTEQLVLPTQGPPQVVHYHGKRGGSQANTPTLVNHQDGGLGSEKGGPETGDNAEDDANNGTMPVAAEVADTVAAER